MSTAWLGLGSNVNAENNIRAGISALEETFSDVSLSPAYASTAVGFEGDDFINLVARVETDLQPAELREYLRDLEDRYGRQRDVPKFSDVHWILIFFYMATLFCCHPFWKYHGLKF